MELTQEQKDKMRGDTFNMMVLLGGSPKLLDLLLTESDIYPSFRKIVKTICGNVLCHTVGEKEYYDNCDKFNKELNSLCDTECTSLRDLVSQDFIDRVHNKANGTES